MRFLQTYYTALGGRRDWRPGFSRLPLVGTVALVISIVGILLSISILIAANGKPIDSWKFQPTVYLSIASTLTNISLYTALLEGVGIVWWNKAMEDNTTIADLHRVWDFGRSFWASLTAGRHFNMVALACILVALAPTNGPLLQRASHIGHQNHTVSMDIDVGISPQLSHGWPTGIITGRTEVVQALTNNFSPVVQNFTDQKAISFPSSLNSTSMAKVQGSGFRAACFDHSVPFNFSYVVGAEQLIFSSSIQYDVYAGDPATCILNLLLKTTPGCLGNYLVRTCNLQVGLMEYPIVIDGAANTIALDPRTTIWDDVAIGDIYNIPQESLYTDNSTYGGVYLALSNKYADRLSATFGGAVGWELLDVSGQTGNAFLQISSGFAFDDNCTVHMKDPTESILQSARDLMFRTAVAAANSSTVQTIRLEEGQYVITYTTNYLFLGLATMVSALAIMSVVFTFNGFWRLGRPVTMSPVEIAKAFNASILRSQDSNAAIDDLLREVGRRPVKYGAVSTLLLEQSEETTSMNFVEADNASEIPIMDDVPRQRLQMVDPSAAGVLQVHEKFSG